MTPGKIAKLKKKWMKVLSQSSGYIIPRKPR